MRASIQPEVWVDHAAAAVSFYQVAFAATVIHQVGSGDDIVAQLAIGDAVIWVGSADASMQRLSPADAGGRTGRLLLVVEDPDATLRAAVDAGASQTAAVTEEHGWRLGRVIDPFGHEWEIGCPPQPWPSH